jgi:hypothetical protein
MIIFRIIRSGIGYYHWEKYGKVRRQCRICAQSEFIADWNKQLKYERQHPSPTAARSQEWRTHACNVALYHEIKTRYGLAYTFLMEHSVPMYCAPTLWMSKCGGGVGQNSLMQIFYTFSSRKPKKSGAQIKICAQVTKCHVGW